MVCSATMPFHRTISYCMTLSLGNVSWAVSVVPPRSQVSSKPLARFFVSRIGLRGLDVPATRPVGAKKVMTYGCAAPLGSGPVNGNYPDFRVTRACSAPDCHGAMD